MLGNLSQLERAILHCRRCERSGTRTRAVPGEGVARPCLLLLGEAPGKKEDLTGRPFVGRAGAYLDKVLAESGVERGDVFITSILKCYSPKQPRKVQIEACRSWTVQQIQTLEPELVLVMGRFAAWGLLGLDRLPQEPVMFKWQNIACLVTCHPAAAMRFPQRNRQFRRDAGPVLRQAYLCRRKKPLAAPRHPRSKNY
jgi:uracil-DNA glycosylase family 4